jgi:uncharacterized DUF497 family protein
MRIAFDPAKRAWTLDVRGLDFLEADEVLGGPNFTLQDLRRDYGESRWITYGQLRGRLIAVCWTPRWTDTGFCIHVFSMRKANEREAARYQNQLGQG